MTSLDGFRAATHLVEVAMHENANCFRIERRSSCCSARFSALFEIVFEFDFVAVLLSSFFFPGSSGSILSIADVFCRRFQQKFPGENRNHV